MYKTTLYYFYFSRRRLCSTATPPSSDESQHGSEEWTPMSTSNSNLVIDESSNMSTDTGDKLSPVSSSTSGNYLWFWTGAQQNLQKDMCVQQRLWSAQTVFRSDQTARMHMLVWVRWNHRQFCRFCRALAQFIYRCSSTLLHSVKGRWSDTSLLMT